MQHLLGIDLGTSSVKALLVTATGEIVGRGSAEYTIDQPHPNWAEQDPARWWQATIAAVGQALSAAPGAAEQVVAVGLSGQMHGTVLLDRAGQLLAPAVIWPDRRSESQVQAITNLIGATRLIELTGSPAATGFQAATLRWFQQQHPELWRQVATVLLPKDYLRWRLAGTLATDPSDGSGSLLLNVQQRDWSAELLELLAINPAQLPPIQPSTAIAGVLTPPAAAALGLPPEILVVTGAADTACSALGAGVVNNRTLLLTLSTGGQLLLPTAEVKVDPLGRLHTFCTAFSPGSTQAGWYQMGALLSAGLSLRWLRDRLFDLSGDNAYHQMSRWAESAPVGANGLLFLPYLLGERTPHMDPQARGIILGLTLEHGRPDLVRAVMEGVALACFDAFTILTESGASPERIVVAGGGARSRLWLQIIADVFNLPVQPLAVTEQSALGAALLAGAGAGLFNLADTAQAWAAYGSPLAPQADHHDRYSELLDIFRQAYPKHQEDFRRLARLAAPPAWPAFPEA